MPLTSSRVAQQTEYAQEEEVSSRSRTPAALPHAQVSVPKEDARHFTRKPIVSAHNLGQLAGYADQDLIRILDNHPRSHLRVWTSGHDPHEFSDWQTVDTTGLNGAEIIKCVKKGRLWINIQRVDEFYESHRTRTRELYDSLSRQVPDFSVEFTHSYLLISSPRSHVYLHFDSHENFFWCIRGGKVFHLYPPDDPEIVSQQFAEDVCAGGDDFFEYKPEFSKRMRQQTIREGQMLSWPQHSPHQVFNNEQINVGLGTFHGTRRSIERALNYAASCYFRSNLPLFHGRVNHGSLATRLRTSTYRVARRVGYVKQRTPTEFWAHRRLDPESPTGLVEIPGGPVLAECSQSAAAQRTA